MLRLLCETIKLNLDLEISQGLGAGVILFLPVKEEASSCAWVVQAACLMGESAVGCTWLHLVMFQSVAMVTGLYQLSTTICLD